MPGLEGAVAIVIALALLLDFLLGEPRRAHPLVGFGRAAEVLERRFNGGERRVLKGMACWLLLILPVALLVLYLDGRSARWGWLGYADDVALLYLAIGWRSMGQHVAPIEAALTRPDSVDLPQARAALAMIVSRDTAAMDTPALLGATVETTLENSADALFASLFWYVVAGPAGVVVHRLANTLDAMWGYRSPRYNAFGRCAARMDDALNLLPAQLLALTFALVSPYPAKTLHCIFSQGWRWKSVNAGAVMASGASALGVVLGGPACYRGHSVVRPPLGWGRLVAPGDLARVRRLVQRSLGAWLLVLAMPTLILIVAALVAV